MIHISYPFYPKRLKEIIKSLKNEEVFRDAPLKNLDNFVYLFYAVFFLPSIFLDIWAMGFFFIIATALSYVMIIRVIKQRILPCSLGFFAEGKIINVPVKENIGSGYGIIECFKIAYRFNQEDIHNKECIVKIPIKRIGNLNLRKEDDIIIGYDNLFPKNNLIILDELLESSCISLEIIEKMQKSVYRE